MAPPPSKLDELVHYLRFPVRGLATKIPLSPFLAHFPLMGGEQR